MSYWNDLTSDQYNYPQRVGRVNVELSRKVVKKPDCRILDLEDTLCWARADGSLSAEVYQLITAAERYITNHTQYYVCRQTIEICLPCFPAECIPLMICPIFCVDGIKYRDCDNCELWVDPAMYFFEDCTPGGSVQCTSSWPATYERKDAVKIHVRVGHEECDIPEDIKLAARVFVQAHMDCEPWKEAVDCLLTPYVWR